MKVTLLAELINHDKEMNVESKTMGNDAFVQTCTSN